MDFSSCHNYLFHSKLKNIKKTFSLKSFPVVSNRYNVKLIKIFLSKKWILLTLSSSYIYRLCKTMMKMKNDTTNKRMNITLSQEFYAQLIKAANEEHLLPSTYAKQLLMKSLPINNNEENKCLTKNGNDM